MASSRVPAIVVSLSALAVIGAATANSLPNFELFLLAEFRSPLIAGFQSFLFAQFQSLRCTFSAKDGFNPDTGSRQRDTEGYSVVAAAKHSRVGVAHAELRNSTGGSEKNIPSTLLASGPGRRSAECVMPLTTSSIPRSNTRTRVVFRTSRKVISPLPKAFRPCFGRRRPAKSCTDSGLGRMIAFGPAPLRLLPCTVRRDGAERLKLGHAS